MTTDLLERVRLPRSWRRPVLIATAVLGLIVGLFTWVEFYRRVPPPAFGSEEDQFLFGSIGTEKDDEVPYWIWLVLPRVFPEYLPAPGGYTSLGFLSKAGHEMPVGLSKVTIGYERVGLNCAACHAGSYRRRADDPSTVAAGAPAQRLDVQAYRRFLVACASDPRFTASTLMAEIAKNYRLSLGERIAFRFVIVPATRRALLRLKERDAWMDRHVPAWGPGRLDLVSLAKFDISRLPADTTIGTADIAPAWTGMISPAAYPLPIDRALAANGEAVFRSACAACHAEGGARTGSAIPIDEVGTDPLRLQAWTPAAASAVSSHARTLTWLAPHFKTNGYIAAPLRGVWLRAPYLHNGSVPSLADLLEPADRRPRVFWRGYDVVEGARVGFDSTSADAQRLGTRFDVTLPGNSSAGHTYGTTLPPDSKRALLEFLKTL